MFTESNSCHRNLDQLQQRGAGRLLGGAAIQSEGIDGPVVNAVIILLWFPTQ